MTSRPRIAYVDGLRCVAIVAVIFYHYLYRWAIPAHDESLYPYGNAYACLGHYGSFGVQLFFTVSGFVITMTLYRCSSAREFAVRRFARLWPALLLCSIITALAVRIIPNHTFRVSLFSFFPSLTFTAPRNWRLLLPMKDLDWVDDAYWSLVVEVRFYVLIALAFFLSQKRFPKVVLGIVVGLLSLSISVLWQHPLLSQFDAAIGAIYLPWFLVGIAFFWMHSNVERKLRMPLLVLAIGTIIVRAVATRSLPQMAAAVFIPAMFWFAGTGRPLNGFLSNQLVTSIGTASYSLYLLHQNIGVALIGYLGRILSFNGMFSVVLMPGVTVLLMCSAKIVFEAWERPMNRRINAWLLAHKDAEEKHLRMSRV